MPPAAESAPPAARARSGSSAGSKVPKPAEDRVGARGGGGATVRAAQKQNSKKAPTGSGGHKFEWKDKTNDGTTAYITDALDAGDPMYSSGAEEENYVLVSEGVTFGADAAPRAPQYCAEHGATLIGPKYTLAEFKLRLVAAIDELFASGEVEECVTSVLELRCPEFAFEIVKRAVSKAVDRRARECELASRLISAGCPRLLSERDVARGFERLFEGLEDLVLDAPGAPRVVSDFLVRCVVDEALPPAYLGDRVFAALGGEIVARARRLLSREHASSKLERLWGPGDGRDVAELKKVVDMLLGEYLATRELGEAKRCVRELAAPAFGHEVVKRAVVAALPHDDEARNAVSRLLAELVADAEGLVSPAQAARGFARLKDALPDLTCDVPNAGELLAAFVERAKADGVLAADA
mmetsp:Transcript_831/g.2517  ORF Transcript_831/g.2517 Transcript_831/m.2517 type:complete len:411 (-) Transcript_831:101-1333(-)